MITVIEQKCQAKLYNKYARSISYKKKCFTT